MNIAHRVAAAVATAAACLAVAPTHAAAPAADTTAKLTWTASLLKVKVDSPKASCEAGRRVFFLLTQGRYSDAATEKTNDNGVFSYPESPTGGTLRAFIGRTPSCRPAQSNDVTRQGSQVPRLAAKARTSATITRVEGGFRVKVDSPKASCKADRRVTVFAYDNTSSSADVLTGITNAKGVAVATYGEITMAGSPSPYKVTAFVRIAAGCNLGQSPTLSFTGTE